MKNGKIISVIIGLLLVSGCSLNEIDKPVNTNSPTVSPNVTSTPKTTSTPTVDNESNFDGPVQPTAEPIKAFDSTLFELEQLYPLLKPSDVFGMSYEIDENFYIIADNNLYGLINQDKKLSCVPLSKGYPKGHYDCIDIHADGQELIELQNTELFNCGGQHGGGNGNGIGFDVENNIIYGMHQGDDGPMGLSKINSNELSENTLLGYNEITNYDSSLEYDVDFDISKKYGIINSELEVLTDAIYDDVFKIDSELIPVKKGDLWGYVNNKGELVIDCIYQATFVSETFMDEVTYDKYEIMPYYPYPVIDGRIVVKNQEGKYGVIDTLGNTLMDFEYEYGSPYYNNSVILKKDGEWIIK